MKLSFATLSPSLACTSMHYRTILPLLWSTPKINQSRFKLFASASNMFHGNMLHGKKRRSANYHPTIWNFQIIDSLSTPYTYELHATQLEELKHQVRTLLLDSTKEPYVQLKLIDSIQRLGVAYHFQVEIKETLMDLSRLDLSVSGDLNTIALHFRLLREHGFPVSSGAFDKFCYEDGKFMDNLKEDAKGLLSLYDASHLGMLGEDALEEANHFSTKNLKLLLGKLQDNYMAEQVQQALDVPLHWRMLRLEARNFINVYEKDDTRNLFLLRLAKLDYNLVQSVYQGELKELARWWKDLGFGEKLDFARDRLMENYLWAMGMIFEPHFSKSRISLTKLVCILTAVDDMYDIYGSLDELQIFTNAINRWDIGAIEELPEYMKICYFAIYNFANELAYGVMKDSGSNILPYLKKEWTNLCKSYLVEARWFCSNYTPSLDEYLENAWISIGGLAAIVHSYMLLSSKDSMDCLNHVSELIYRSSLITRLTNDLGTSIAESKRGDVIKSIQCYMIKENASEEEAKEHIKGLIRHSWKKLNEGIDNKCSLMNLLCLNMARTSQCIFQYGDGIGTSIGITRDRLTSLIIQPISIC
ncbi:hypothetical protein JCGZ_17017 [Jatropha curcas]|uniref:Uncharacterized protein n=1 Tax=Jatropha curcas TaxID=180498 RepID=A0A067KDD2_JATCU|nr:probable terpene synthase 9 [Jatropha curcas]KDP30235.1 hypothetical protein JCGZ_17017 [Jatropha curcas]